MAKTKPKPSAAQRKLAEQYKNNPPSGTFIGPEANKGRLPKGYKGPEKGKYYGPDKYKGQVKAYNTARGITSPATGAAPAPASGTDPEASPSVENPNTETGQPQQPEQGNAYQPPNPNGAVTNGSGTVQLQSTHDLDMQLIDAIERHAQETAAADYEEGQAGINATEETNALNERRIGDKGSLNKNLAYRGMGRGSTAIQQSTKMGNQHLTEQNQIAARRKLASDNALARRTASENSLNAKKKQIDLERAKYTMDNSGTAPTEGSQPEESGVNPIQPPSPASAPAPAPASASTPSPTVAPAAAPAAAQRTFKGTYRGPDLLKGDAKRLAAWRKAGRPKVTKANAKNFR